MKCIHEPFFCQTSEKGLIREREEENQDMNGEEKPCWTYRNEIAFAMTSTGARAPVQILKAKTP